MDILFKKQREGYELALDKLIRDAEPNERKLRAQGLLGLEERSEVEYRNTTILRKIHDLGFGEFRQDILGEGNSDLDRFDWRVDLLGHYDRQKAFRDREDVILDEFLTMIGDYSESEGVSSKDRRVEIRYLKNMVERQIQCRGLRGDIIIPSDLDRQLGESGLDVSFDYNLVLQFSMDFVNSKGNNLEAESPNLYLLNHDEHPIHSSGHFPGGSLELLRFWGIIGKGPLEHYFLYSPEEGRFSIQVPQDEYVCNNNVTYPGSGGLLQLVSKYSNEEFNNPRLAIAPLSHAGMLKKMFVDNGYNIVQFQ